MTENIVGKIPEFTTDDSSESQDEVVNEGNEKIESEEEETDEEKETLSEEEASEEEPVGELADDNTTKLEKANQGLLQERTKLLKEISELKGQRREIKKDELVVVQQKLDDLKDVHPQDVELIDKVLKSKGYVTKAEAQNMYYESVRQDVLAKFLDKYPEYKPENDPNDLNWSRFNRELSDYRLPEDPLKLMDILEKAHRGISEVSSDRSSAASQRRTEIASAGAGGRQRSSSRPSDDRIRRAAESGQLQGWSEEEIEEMQLNN